MREAEVEEQEPHGIPQLRHPDPLSQVNYSCDASRQGTIRGAERERKLMHVATAGTGWEGVGARWRGAGPWARCSPTCIRGPGGRPRRFRLCVEGTPSDPPT